MMQKQLKFTGFLLCFLFLIFESKAQVFINLPGDPGPLIFSTPRDFDQGVFTNYQLWIGSNLPNASVGWDLSLHATGDLTYRGNSIPIENIHIRLVNRVLMGMQPFYLSTTPQYLVINSRYPKFVKPVPLLLKITAIGGNDFFVPSGAYTTTLVFTLTED
ncbi:MAG: hypothetical protein R2879_03495 [Saprospiraceae bacterium]